MSTRYTENPRRTLLQEASDSRTDPERLRYLAHHEREEVRLAAIQNPGVPEDVWRKALLEGKPEAWSNPMAPIYLLVWSPQPGDQSTLESAIRRATQALWKNPKRCSPDGKVLLNVQLMNWWAASVSAIDMIRFLWKLASKKMVGSDDHRAAVRITVLCMNTLPKLLDKDRLALSILDAWCAKQDDRRMEAEKLAYSYPVKRAVYFAMDNSIYLGSEYIISHLLDTAAFGKEGTERDKAIAEHNRLLADLIRREMPLPPQVK